MWAVCVCVCVCVCACVCVWKGEGGLGGGSGGNLDLGNIVEFGRRKSPHMDPCARALLSRLWCVVHE